MTVAATSYVSLVGAITLEVLGTCTLPATRNFSAWLPTVAVLLCYSASFYLLTFAIRDIPLAIVYATWSGVGVCGVAVVGMLVYGQRVAWQVAIGLALIVIGVSVVNVFSKAPGHAVAAVSPSDTETQ